MDLENFRGQWGPALVFVKIGGHFVNDIINSVLHEKRLVHKMQRHKTGKGCRALPVAFTL